ncbi:MAG: hypothetical protein AAGE52_16355 [Myxococcota bacterium]
MLERWRKLLRAVEAHAGVEVTPVREERLALMRTVGLPEVIAELLAEGYPTRPIRLGTLTFFPPRETLGRTGRWPVLFFVAEAWARPREIHRRLPDGRDPAGEWVELATAYLEAVGAREPFGLEAQRNRTLRWWRPIVEERIVERLGDRAERAFDAFGPALAADDYRMDLESRLHWARLWVLLGILIALYVVSRDGGLPGRLVVAAASLGGLSGALGFVPWSRANSRLRVVDDPADL